MKPNKTVVPTLTEIAANRAAIQQNLAALEKQEQELKEQAAGQVKAALESFPQTLSQIVGRPLTLGEALKMGAAHLRGKLNLSANGDGRASGVRAYRRPLSEDEKIRLKQVLSIRQAVIDGGGSPKQTISEISREFKTTDATVNKYKAQWGLTRGAHAPAT